MRLAGEGGRNNKKMEWKKNLTEIRVCYNKLYHYNYACNLCTYYYTVRSRSKWRLR